MAEEINPQNQSSAPPAPAVTVRTMESDIKSIEQGGGEMVESKPFVYSAGGDGKLKPEKVEAELGLPGYIGPEKPIFSSSAALSSEQLPAKKSAKGKRVLIIVIILTIIVGLGLLGYFVISPMLFPKQMPVVQ